MTYSFNVLENQKMFATLVRFHFFFPDDFMVHRSWPHWRAKQKLISWGPGAFVAFHSFCLECLLPALPHKGLVITHHPSKPDLTFLPPKQVLEFCTVSSEEDNTHLHIRLPTELQDARNRAPSQPHSGV